MCTPQKTRSSSSTRISWANWHIPMTNLLNCGCKFTPQEMLPTHRPTQKHPSPSVGKLLPNKSLFSTSQAQQAIISPTTGASAMVPPAKLCEAISLHEGGCLFFHFFNLEGFVHIPRLTALQYAKGASVPRPPTGEFTKTIYPPGPAMRKHSLFMAETFICFTSNVIKLNEIHHLTGCKKK